jgi:hypothetical protein
MWANGKELKQGQINAETEGPEGLGVIFITLQFLITYEFYQ